MAECLPSRQSCCASTPPIVAKWAAARLPRVALTGKKILLTGGAGFIGTTLARRLIEENEIVILDNLHRDSLTGTDLAEHPNLRFVQGDVLDLPLVRELAARATHVVHMAAIAGVDKVLESPVRTMRVNLMGTFNVLEAAHEAGTIERLVDFSTSEVFGTHAYKVEETHVTSQGSVGEARWTYAVSKLAGEYLAHSYFDEYGLPAVSVRPFNVYGPGQVGSGAIHHFTVRALAGDELVIHGDGSQIRAWCFVDDIVEALLLLLERKEAVGQVFNIGNPRSVVTVFDLAARIKRLGGSESEIIFRPLHYTDVEMRIPNVDKAQKLLGWEPRVDLDDGLERTIAWYRERRPVQSLASKRRGLSLRSRRCGAWPRRGGVCGWGRGAGRRGRAGGDCAAPARRVRLLRACGDQPERKRGQ